MRAKSDHFEFSEQTGDTIVQGLPPIVGSTGGSTWFGNGGHVPQNEFELPQDATCRFSILYDSQCDYSTRETTVFGGSDASGTVRLCENAAGAPGLFHLHLSDGLGASLDIKVGLSRSAGKRIAVTVNPQLHSASVYELHAWSRSPGMPLDCDVSAQGTLSRIGPRSGQFTLGGCRANGNVTECFTGRLANFAVYGHVLESESIMRYTGASDNPCALSDTSLGKPSTESLQRFKSDLLALRKAVAKPGLDESDFHSIALVVFRWLFDRQPHYVDICAKLGVQLWFSGRGPNAERFFQTISGHEPIFYAAGDFDGPLDRSWKTLDKWKSETILMANGGGISTEAFVKFVRNKLGAGHFDETDRTRWQQDLKEISDTIRIGGNQALYFQMKAIANSVLNSVAATRIEPLLST